MIMPRERGFFITGTDTGVGKTWVTVALMENFKKKGRIVLGFKPVASGCAMENGNLKNPDALLIGKYASFSVPYESINPYAYEPPISPHIAADQVNHFIRFDKILANFGELQRRSDCVFVEGVGGWEAPLNSEQTVADLAAALKIPVILVIGLRLGCLNHGILTYEAIIRSGVDCAGWVANAIEPDFAFEDENIHTLQQKIDAPMLGRLPYRPGFAPGVLSQSLNLNG